MDILACVIVIIIGAASIRIAFSLGHPRAPWRRYLSAVLFVFGALIWGFASVASLLFHDGILPDDIRTEGLSSVLSYLRAVAPGVTIGCASILLGISIRVLGLNRRPDDTKNV